MYNDFVEQKQIVHLVSKMMEQAGESLKNEVDWHQETKALLKQVLETKDEEKELRVLAENSRQKSMDLLKLTPSLVAKLAGEDEEHNGNEVDYKDAYHKVVDLADTQNEYMVALEARVAKGVVDFKQRAAILSFQHDAQIMRDGATWGEFRIFELQQERVQMSENHAKELKRLNSRISTSENDRLQKLKSVGHARVVTAATMNEINRNLGTKEHELKVMRKARIRLEKEAAQSQIKIAELQKEIDELKQKPSPAVHGVKRTAEDAEYYSEDKAAKKIKQENGV